VAADDSVEVVSPPHEIERRKQSFSSRKSSEVIQHSTGGLFELVKSNENSHNVSQILDSARS
jgi:hypothetical protein